MIPQLNFVKANTVLSAIKLLSSDKNARLIAGGTDVIPGFQIESKRFKDVKLLIDINSIKELKTIKRFKDRIEIGSAVTFSELITSNIIQSEFPLLVNAASTVGSVQIRNLATLAGNFINNASCADSVPPLLVYNARIEIRSLKETRQISLEKFLLEPYRTKLKKNEIVTKVVLPLTNKNVKGDFYKLGRRRAVAISRISLAVLVELDNSIIKDIRIASGAVTPIGVRFYDLEKFAIGEKVDSDFLKKLSIELGKTILKVTGLRWSSPYKLPVVQQMFYQLLEKVCNE
ncbi:MAG: FAD binding domain-containing protein [Bacteroidetes bacterium]|nr:FAD binding domain-containing protein [Bacteroidota bacterium]MBU2585206.1 FAD binding domain-containing protein [Bacteroidota bacterium]